MNNQAARGRVRKARTEDVEYIYRWLQHQEMENIEDSFLCNWNLTLESFNEGNLIVFIEADSMKAVAYQWGALTSPGILEVRKDMRGRGIGKRLVEYRIKQARKKGVCIFRIQCVPASSIPFWEKMGFELFKDGSNHAYQIIEQDLDVFQEGTEADISVVLYPNSRLWDKTVTSSKVLHQCGVMTNDHVVYLRKRICIPGFREFWGGDVVIDIRLKEKSLYFGKAKYKEARLLGIEQQELVNNSV